MLYQRFLKETVGKLSLNMGRVVIFLKKNAKNLDFLDFSFGKKFLSIKGKMFLGKNWSEVKEWHDLQKRGLTPPNASQRLPDGTEQIYNFKALAAKFKHLG